MKSTLTTTAATHAEIFEYTNATATTARSKKKVFSFNDYLVNGFFEQRVEALNAAQDAFVFQVEYQDKYTSYTSMIAKTMYFENEFEVLISYIAEDSKIENHEISMMITCEESGDAETFELDLALLFDADSLVVEIDKAMNKVYSDTVASEERRP